MDERSRIGPRILRARAAGQCSANGTATCSTRTVKARRGGQVVCRRLNLVLISLRPQPPRPRPVFSPRTMAPQPHYTASSTSVSSTSASTSAPIEFNSRHDHVHAVTPGLRPHTRPGHFGGTVSTYRDHERYFTPSGPYVVYCLPHALVVTHPAQPPPPSPTPASSGQTSGASTPAPITPAEAPHDYYFEPAIASGSSQPGSIIRADTIP